MSYGSPPQEVKKELLCTRRLAQHAFELHFFVSRHHLRLQSPQSDQSQSSRIQAATFSLSPLFNLLPFQSPAVCLLPCGCHGSRPAAAYTTTQPTQAFPSPWLRPTCPHAKLRSWQDAHSGGLSGGGRLRALQGCPPRPAWRSPSGSAAG